MFGHHDDDKHDDTAIADESIDQAIQAHGDDQADDNTPAPLDQAGSTVAPDGDPGWQHPGKPLDDKPKEDVVSPAGGFPQAHPFPQASQDNGDDDMLTGDDTKDSELVGIKQHALDELAPLIDNLELSAEEKFRTIMMVIQSSDNQELIPKAYEAAHAIQDEKTRAQALLDVVNEINYFTHKPPVGG